MKKREGRRQRGEGSDEKDRNWGWEMGGEKMEGRKRREEERKKRKKLLC